MAADDLKVDVDELRDAATRLDRLVATVSSCHPAREDAFGSSTLADAAREFRTRWGRGVDDLRDALMEGAARLRAAADAFELADREAAEQVCMAPR